MHNRIRIAELEVLAALAVLGVIGACTTVRTESRVTVDPIEVKPITLNVNANVNLVVSLDERARQVVDRLTGEEPTSLLRDLWRRWLPFAAAPAHAQAEEAEDAYRAAVRRERGRWSDILRWADRGCLGFDNRALLSERPCGDLSDTDARARRGLIEASNADREAVYDREFRDEARDRGIADEETEMYRREFRAKLAQRWREKARRGHWIQAPADRREFVVFRNTPLGGRLAEAIETDNLAPGGWYRVP